MRSDLLTYCSEGTLTACIASEEEDILLILVRAIPIAPGVLVHKRFRGKGELGLKEQGCVESKSNVVRKERKEKKRKRKRRRSGGPPFYRDCDHPQPPVFFALRRALSPTIRQLQTLPSSHPVKL